MKKTIIKKYCDICESEIPINKDKLQISVIFTTEQAEGRAITPYLTRKSLHICDSCKSIILEGNMVFGSGAMGYNKYWFKETTLMQG